MNGAPEARGVRPWAWWIAAVGSALVLVVASALATADRRVETVSPEHPETFHLKEYETGTYVVLAVGDNPCYSGQTFEDCASALQREFDSACQDVQLTLPSKYRCGSYRSIIKTVREFSGEIEGPGELSQLKRVALTDVRLVGNNDAVRAETREAVCYLGFVGDCDDPIEPRDAAPPDARTANGPVFIVTADGRDPCHVGQPWRACVRLRSIEFRGACRGYDKSAFTNASWDLCVLYGNELDEARSDLSGTVSVRGGLGTLTRHSTREPADFVEDDHVASRPGADVDRALLRFLRSSRAEAERRRITKSIADGEDTADVINENIRLADRGLIDDVTPCVIAGYAYELSDEVIASACTSE